MPASKVRLHYLCSQVQCRFKSRNRVQKLRGQGHKGNLLSTTRSTALSSRRFFSRSVKAEVPATTVIPHLPLAFDCNPSCRAILLGPKSSRGKILNSFPNWWLP